MIASLAFTVPHELTVRRKVMPLVVHKMCDPLSVGQPFIGAVSIFHAGLSFSVKDQQQSKRNQGKGIKGQDRKEERLLKGWNRETTRMKEEDTMNHACLRDAAVVQVSIGMLVLS